MMTRLVVFFLLYTYLRYPSNTVRRLRENLDLGEGCVCEVIGPHSRVNTKVSIESGVSIMVLSGQGTRTRIYAYPGVV